MPVFVVGVFESRQCRCDNLLLMACCRRFRSWRFVLLFRKHQAGIHFIRYILGLGRQLLIEFSTDSHRMKFYTPTLVPVALAAFCVIATFGHAAEPRSFVGSSRAILGTLTSLTASARIGDFDGDGDLDVAVANGRHWPQQNFLFLNQVRGRFNVQRRLGADWRTTYATEVADLDGVLIARKKWLLDHQPPRGDRADWHREVTEINRKLSGCLNEHRHKVAADLANARRQASSEAVLSSREHPFCVFNMDYLQETFARLLGGSSPANQQS